MESRSAAMAKRKALREERKLQVEKERAERLQKEEETKLAAEMEAKETLAAQRREEKRIAKQVFVDSYCNMILILYFSCSVS